MAASKDVFKRLDNFIEVKCINTISHDGWLELSMSRGLFIYTYMYSYQLLVTATLGRSAIFVELSHKSHTSDWPLGDTRCYTRWALLAQPF